MINKLWFSLVAIAFIGIVGNLLQGNTEVINQSVASLFEMAQLSFDIALGLVGILSLWLGLLRLGERAGMVQLLGNILAPLFHRILPEIPKNHPSLGHITMNMAANVMGLDNAATPMGLKAMESLQQLNPQKDTASRAQTLFLVLNSSSLTVFPVTIFMYRAQMGAISATDVFIPILIATGASSITGFLVTSLVLRLKIWQPVVLAYLGGAIVGVSALAFYFSQLPAEELSRQSSLWGNGLLLVAVFGLIFSAARKRVAVFEEFVEGAKEGFHLAIKILPYLVAMLVMIGLLRASGALGLLLDLIRSLVNFIGWDARFVEALPTALMKPLSGSGARAMMLDAMNEFGVDSFVGHLVAIVQGSTETTFYVLAVYFGSVGIRHARTAIWCALSADLAGIIAAILVGYLFFG